MTTRKPFVAGNWKLNKTLAQSLELVDELAGSLGELTSAVDVAVAPVFTALAAVGQRLDGGGIGLCAQNMHWEASGAFTGEVGREQLLDVGCKYVIVGHSERRQFFGDTDDNVARKTLAVLDALLGPIVCVGESLEQRKSGSAQAVVVAQVGAALKDVDGARMDDVVLAYEPIWAIGTGETASPADAQEMHAAIRAHLVTMFDESIASAVRIQYGGSVKPANAAELMAQPDIDGALVGGASLTAGPFTDIVAAARAAAAST